MTRRAGLRRQVGRILTTAIIGALLAGSTTSVALAAAEDGVAKKSTFLDLGGSTPEEIAATMDQICAEHRDPNSDNYIMNVVLVGVVDQRGRLRVPQLLAVLPHVPGGGGQTCFDNVFVGPAYLDSSTLPWKSRPDIPPDLETWCADSLYCGGILTGSWRWDNLEANRRATQIFLAFVNLHYPGVRANVQWYVTYEGYFDWLGDNAYSENVRMAYESYLLEMVKIYNTALRRAGEPAESASRAVLWSPSYASSYSAISASKLDLIRQNLRSMFYNVKTAAAAEGISRGVDWLDMQDKIGQTDCFSVECYVGVKQWFEFLASVNNEQFAFASLRVNMELFSSNLPAPDLNERMARENFYETNGIPIGASWELRYLTGAKF